MRRNRRGPKNLQGRAGRSPGKWRSRSGQAPRRPQPVSLRYVDELSLGAMLPGDIILVTESASLKRALESMFFALLACPACGTVGLITSAQYSGNSPMMCASDRCSCRFRIDSRSRLTFLPVD